MSTTLARDRRIVRGPGTIPQNRQTCDQNSSRFRIDHSYSDVVVANSAAESPSERTCAMKRVRFARSTCSGPAVGAEAALSDAVALQARVAGLLGGKQPPQTRPRRRTAVTRDAVSLVKRGVLGQVSPQPLASVCIAPQHRRRHQPAAPAGAGIARRAPTDRSAPATDGRRDRRPREVGALARDERRILGREVREHRGERRVLLQIVEHDLVVRVAVGVPGVVAVVPAQRTEAERRRAEQSKEQSSVPPVPGTPTPMYWI